MRATHLAVTGSILAGAVLVTLRLPLGGPVAPTSQSQNAVAMDDTARISAGLLRRLAAAADGYRTGEPIWIVASTLEPYSVVGVFSSFEEARRRAMAVRGGRPYGPYVTPRDEGRPVMFVPVPHSWPTIYGFDSTWNPPALPWLVSDVDSIVITAYNRSGATWRVSRRGNETDAVFFTLSAHDKFVAPYYAALSGLEEATRMRETILQYIRRSPVPYDGRKP